MARTQAIRYTAAPVVLAFAPNTLVYVMVIFELFVEEIDAICR